MDSSVIRRGFGPILPLAQFKLLVHKGFSHLQVNFSMSTSSLWLPNVILLVQGLNLWLGKQNFLILTLCVYLIKKRFSQFLSHWELAEPVFCIEELNYLPYKNKSLVLWREIQNGAWWEFILRVSSTRPTLFSMKYKKKIIFCKIFFQP